MDRQELVDHIMILNQSMTGLTQGVLELIKVEVTNEGAVTRYKAQLAAAEEKIEELQKQLQVTARENEELRQATRHLVNLRTKREMIPVNRHEI